MFCDKERHQLFLGARRTHRRSICSRLFKPVLPEDVQRDLVHSIKGSENADDVNGYAIEYDMVLLSPIYGTPGKRENFRLQGWSDKWNVRLRRS